MPLSPIERTELFDLGEGIVDIATEPVQRGRVARVFFRAEDLDDLDLVDLKVGKDSQLAATGPLTGEAFETRAVGVRMELDTAQPGIVITLRVKNIDTAAHDFKAVLYGRVLE